MTKIGDNGASHEDRLALLEDRIFADPSTTIEDIFQVLKERIHRSHAADIHRLSTDSARLLQNKSRMPDNFNEEATIRGLNFINRLASHADKAEQLRSSIEDTAKAFTKQLGELCAAVDAGLSPLEKSVREKIAGHLEARINSYNANRGPDEPLMTSTIFRSPAGTSVSLSFAQDIEITDPALLPREYLVPDTKLLLKTMEKLPNDQEIPGISRKRKLSPRFTTK